MSEKRTLLDKAFESDEDWVPAQHVSKIQAPCGCRLSVYSDDVLPGPQLDMSRCEASQKGLKLERAKQIIEEIAALKKEAARL